MKSTLWPVLAIVFSFTPGNIVLGQDDALPGTTMGYSAQGNVAMSKAQHEAETQRAVLAARQKRALKEAMAVYAVKPPVITTPEQFLAVHRPPAPQNTREDSEMSPVKTSTYVPEFEAPGITREQAAGNVGALETESDTSSMGGFFDRLKARKTVNEPVPPASTYTQAGPITTAAAVPSTASIHEATAGASSKKSSFFARLFGREKQSPAESIARPNLPAAPASNPTTSEGTGATAALSEDGIPAASAPTTPTAQESAMSDSTPSIFRQPTSSDGEASTVKFDHQAKVDGVLVRLYEGTAVAVLSRSGDMASIRLPDGRVGTISSNALSQ